MKKIILASLLGVITVSAHAITEAEKIIQNQATNQLVVQQLSQITKVDAEVLAKLNQIVAAAAQVIPVVNPETVTEIITAAVLASPDKAFEIVQAAVEQNPELVNEIIQAAVDAGADEGEMIAAALAGGVSDADIDLATAVGNFSSAPVLGATPSQTGSGGGAGGIDPTISNN